MERGRRARREIRAEARVRKRVEEVWQYRSGREVRADAVGKHVGRRWYCNRNMAARWIANPTAAVHEGWSIGGPPGTVDSVTMQEHLPEHGGPANCCIRMCVKWRIVSRMLSCIHQVAHASASTLRQTCLRQSADLQVHTKSELVHDYKLTVAMDGKLKPVPYMRCL